MKKTVLILCLSLFVVLLTAGCSLLDPFFYGEAHIYKERSSPDGKYVAYIFESSGGATSGFMCHISVLPADEPPPKRGPGNVFRIEGLCADYDMEWLSDDELYVRNFRSSRTILQKESIYGIKITYRFMND